MSAPPTIKDTLLGDRAEQLPARPRVQEFQQQIGQISRQSSVFFAGTIFTVAAAYLFKVYLARVLGAEALGLYALGMTIAGFIGIFNTLGLPQSAVRFVAMYCATKSWKKLAGFLVRASGILLVLNIVLAVVLLLVGPGIAVHFYHAPALIPYLPLFALIMLLGALNLFLGQVLAGYKHVTRRTVITSFLASPINIGLTVLLIMLGMGLRGYIVAQVASAAVVLVLLATVVWRMTPKAAQVPIRDTPSLDPEIISFSVTAFGIGFLEFTVGQSDKVLIGFFLDARSVGIYAVAAAIVAFIPILLQSVNQIFSPVIADLHARGERELLGRMFQTLTKWVLAFTIPLAAVVIALAHPMMNVFGRDFEVGWPILVIGTIGQLVNCGVGSVGYMLLMSGNQRRLIKVQAAAGVLTVLLNLALIPHWGIIGAAAAAAITTAVSNAWFLKEVRSALGLSPYNRSYARLLPAAVVAVGVAIVLRTGLSGIQPAWMSIVVSLPLVYLAFTSLAAVSGLNEDDRIIARAVWARVRGKFEAAPTGVSTAAVIPFGPSEGPAQPQNVDTETGSPPIFIVGPSRSGTTLLARMLDAHSALAIFPETWCYVVLDRLGCFEGFNHRWQYILFLNQVWDSLRQYNDPAADVLAQEAAKRPSYVGPVRPVLDSFGRAYALARGAEFWGEKTPGHVLWLPQIRTLFPRARILISVRDPLDIIASYDERWGGGRADTKYLMRSAANVRHYLRHLLQERGFPADQVMMVRYEQLTARPDEVLQRICGFLGVDFEPGMLEFYRNGGNPELDSAEGLHHKLLARPATTERVGRYRQAFSPAQIALIENFLGEEMHLLDYSAESSTAVAFTAEESDARGRALALYEQMRSGEIREKFRRRGKLKLDAYRWLGRPLAALPWRHLAVTQGDWEARIRPGA